MSKDKKGHQQCLTNETPLFVKGFAVLQECFRSNSITALENIALWHERDISHSSSERIIIPDSFIILDYILEKTIFVVENLNVIPANMQRNLMKYGGIIFSQRVLLELINKGLLREDAYSLVQAAALESLGRRRKL